MQRAPQALIASSGALRVAYVLMRLTLLEALRGRVPWLAALILLAAAGCAWFAQTLSLAEAEATRALVFGSLARLGLVALLAAQVSTTLARALADRELEFILAGPAPRWSLVLGKAAGFSALALLLALCATLVAWPLSAGAQALAVLLWGGGLAAELVAVAALGLLVSLSFNQPATALLAAGAFYVFARSASAAVAIAGFSAQASGSPVDAFVHAIAQVLSFLVPPLDRLANADWLAGGAPVPQAAWFALLALGYALLYGAAAAVDLSRKAF